MTEPSNGDPPSTTPGALTGGEAEFRPDWDQLGVPIVALAGDGRLLRCNRSFQQLARSGGVDAASHPSQWLQIWANDSRALWFAALADRRASVSPLGWIGGPGADPARAASVQRWYAASLRWRQNGSYCIAVLHDVSAVRRAELATRAQVEQMRQIANTVAVCAAYVDPVSYTCLYANASLAQLFGHDEAAAAGKSIEELLGAEGARLAQPAIEQVLRTRQPSRYQQWIDQPATAPASPQGQTESGRLRAPSRHLDVTVSPHVESGGGLVGLVFTMADVTALHDAELSASEAQRRLSRFLHAGVEAIAIHRDGVVIDVNPAFCDLLGYPLDEVLGQELAEFAVADQRPRVARVLASEQDRSIETAMQPADGSRLPVELFTRQVYEDGLPLGTAIIRDVRSRNEAQERLQFLAHHDALTGLPNRQSFMGQLERLMTRARAKQAELALLFIDLDAFRRVNDSLGHSAGDARLQTVARRITENLRSTDQVARFGGDEFIVLLPGTRGHTDLLGVAHKLQSAIAAPLDVESGSISLTASIGVAVFPQDGETPDALIRHADAAMLRAKENGSAGCVFYEPEHADSAYADLVLESQLGTAITQQEFTLLFQPQVDAAGHTVGAEALIRWQHPQRGLLSPDEFIELAEQHRLMLPIGRWVLQTAARAARDWYAVAGTAALSVAVNLSTLQFRAEDFVATVAEVLHDSGLPRGWLELELTERMLVDDLDDVRQRLDQLRALGVRISVDDFGTGYSSLGHLKDLPIDKLKIDRSFVCDLPQGRHAGAIVSAIIQLGHSLDLVVVAEGVESPAQRRFLASLGCDVMQGLGISAPLDAGQMLDWLTEHTQPTPLVALRESSSILLGTEGGVF
jgi:diguanylate cyclase (GGDEF)-like protein/PAS domain S-box-containing protein